MCFFKDKWPKKAATEEEQKQTKEYILAIQHIDTIHKIVMFIKPFLRKEDIKDFWQAPYKTYHLKTYDCEDMAIMAIDILSKYFVSKKLVSDISFIIYEGYFIKEGIRKKSAHAVAMFYLKGDTVYEAGYYEFTNKTLRHAFKKSQKDYIKYGYIHYPEGLKSFERRDSTGKIIERKRAWMGYLK